MRALAQVFRGKFLELLAQALARNALKLPPELGALGAPAARRRWLQEHHASPWVVYLRRPQQVLDYLGRYTHRVALSNSRLLASDAQSVTFAWRDRAHGNRPRRLTLTPEQFLGHFLLHVLPKGFVRNRHYGLVANRTKSEKLAAARLALDAPTSDAAEPISVATFLMRVCGIDLASCPHCVRGPLVLLAIETPQPRSRAPPPRR